MIFSRVASIGMPHRLLRRLAALLLSAALPGFAQEPAPPAAGSPSENAAVEQALRSFQEKLAGGDLAGAIAELESLVSRPDAPPVSRGILGGLYVEAGRMAEAYELLGPMAERAEADPAVLYNAGRAAIALGEHDRGVAFLERAARAAPHSPAARELGLVRGREGRYAEAYVLLAPWVKAHPDDLVATRAAAAGAVQLERIPEAEALLGALPQSDPGVRLLWGQLLLTKGDPFGTIQMLAGILEQAPDQVGREARRLLAQAHLQVGESEQAVAMLDGHVAADPTLALLLGQAHYQNGDVEAALEVLQPFSEQVLENEEGRKRLAPSLVASLSREYGRLLVAAGRSAEAIPHLELATTADPENRVGWQALGQALAASGERERAQQALAKFRELDAKVADDSAGINRRQQDLADPTGKALRQAQEHLYSGEEDKALALLRREAVLKPNDPRPLILEARALLGLDRAEEGLAAGQRALGIAPDNADAHYVVGTLLMALHRLEEAEESLRRALELAPEHTAALNDLAVLLIEVGRRDEAKPLLERALALNPDDPVAKANLERLASG